MLFPTQAAFAAEERGSHSFSFVNPQSRTKVAGCHHYTVEWASPTGAEVTLHSISVIFEYNYPRRLEPRLCA